MKLILPALFLFLIYLIRKFFQNKSILMSQSGEVHQKFINKISVPLLGGIFIFFSYLIIYFDTDHKLFLIFLSLIFLLGLTSDLKFIQSAKIRFFFQILIIFLAVITLDLKISSTRVLIIDNLNENIYFNYFFITLCILILINGSNFIDGLNGLCLGYYLLVIIALMNIGIDSSIFLDHEKILIILTIFLILLLNNFLNLLFIGDSGAYVLGIIFSFNLINIYNLNPNISPFYIILLLWYPSFELLFSIIRKFNFRSSPIKPDTNHLHQLIFFFINNKFKFNNLLSNNFSSFIIIIYNIIIFYFSSQDIKDTQFQVILISLSIIVYSFSYIKLLKWKLNRKHKY